MKDISELSKSFTRMGVKLQNNLVKAQEQQALKTYNDVYNTARVDTGAYRDSIYVTPTEINNGVIETFIGSKMQVETKDGKSYNLGWLLETGTDPHAIPNAFGWGDIYGYDSPQYQRTLEDDWHPGTMDYNTYYNAKVNNESNYQMLLQEAAKDAFKGSFK